MEPRSVSLYRRPRIVSGFPRLSRSSATGSVKGEILRPYEKGSSSRIEPVTNWTFYNAPPPTVDPNTGAETTAPGIDPSTPASITYAEYIAISNAIAAIADLQTWRTATTTTLDQIQTRLGNQSTTLHNIQTAQNDTITSIRNIELIVRNLTQQSSTTSAQSPTGADQTSTSSSSDPTTTTTSTTSSSQKPPTFTLPDKFKGKASDVEFFIREVKDAVELLGLSLPSDRHKCIWMSTLLGDGSPRQWYFSLMTGEPTVLNSFDDFVECFKDHFGDSNLNYNAEVKLKKLKQTGSAAAYASRFSELVVHVDWSESTKINQFYSGLRLHQSNPS
ncbi:hypothetical protein D9758_015228 [Tetrapyrgos nigripes]|uniref:Retrotransposon gag domain-containing protein n=1 Tax=Tetrapyrgos nigripes TaxID=182062 RepID=A0A8H5FMY8_9AGAR|nr:hypothetical protein D9758_015228 [Tetrapyrgos nigripes]